MYRPLAHSLFAPVVQSPMKKHKALRVHLDIRNARGLCRRGRQVLPLALALARALSECDTPSPPTIFRPLPPARAPPRVPPAPCLVTRAATRFAW